MSVTNFKIKMHESNKSINVKRKISKLNYRLQLLYHCYDAFLFYFFFSFKNVGICLFNPRAECVSAKM